MKSHPTPNKRNLTTSLNGGVLSSTTTTNPKKLKRLPHVFAKVLELPFNSDADILVHETPQFLRFVAENGETTVTDDFRAHVIEILPGITKIEVMRGGSDEDDSCSVKEPQIDAWRVRLPSTTLPQMTSVTTVDGQLIVTVPKAVDFVLDEEDPGEELFLVE